MARNYRARWRSRVDLHQSQAPVVVRSAEAAWAAEHLLDKAAIFGALNLANVGEEFSPFPFLAYGGERLREINANQPELLSPVDPGTPNKRKTVHASDHR